MFAARRDVFMAGNVNHWVLRHQGGAQAAQGLVLQRFKTVAFQPFKFNPHRIVVAVAAAPVVRLPGVPGPRIATDKLPQLACAADKKV